MARRTVIFSDFSKGEFGFKNPYNAPKGSWTGDNLHITLTGELCVRPGLEQVVPTGSGPTAQMAHAMSVLDQGKVLVLAGTAVQTVTTGSASSVWSAAAATSLDLAPSAESALCRGGAGRMFYTDRADASTYQIVCTAATPVVTKFTGPGGAAIAVYGDRLVIGNTGTGSDQNTIRYSAAADYTSWPTANSIKVGADSSPITCLYVQNGNLLVGKTEGWFIITGTIGVNENLRQLNQYAAPSNQSFGDITNHDTLAYFGGFGEYPYRFNGSYATPYTEFAIQAVVGATSAAALLREEDSFLLHGSFFDDVIQRIWLYHRGAWTRHTIPDTVFGLASFDSIRICPDVFSVGALSSDPRPNGSIITVLVQDTGNAPDVYRYTVGSDRPGFETDTLFQRAGDDAATAVAGNFSLPEWWADEGSEILVRGVTVDFRVWNTGSSDTNHFDIQVDNFSPYNSDAPASSTILDWDELGTLTTAGVDGEVKRHIFSFGDQGVGNGFQLHFTNMRGIAIRRVQVLIDSQPVRL